MVMGFGALMEEREREVWYLSNVKTRDGVCVS